MRFAPLIQADIFARLRHIPTGTLLWFVSVQIELRANQLYMLWVTEDRTQPADRQ
jgi:hypothetical protein